MRIQWIFLPVFYLLIVPFLANGQDMEQRLRNHVTVLASDSLEGRGLGTRGKDKAIEYITTQMAGIGLEPLRPGYLHEFQFRSSLAWIPATNLVGVIRGSDPVLKNEFIVIGAHFDHLGYSLNNDGSRKLFPGADDNASGVAALLEIAGQMKAAGIAPKRSIVFVAFDAEESGLIGSERFLMDSLVDPASIKIMFSLDMVGMLAAYGGLDMKGIESLTGGGSLAASIAAQKGIKIKKAGAEIEARTDTKPFGDKGIPSAHVFTGLKSPYHKPEDKADLLDYPGMVQVVDYMAALVQALSEQESLQAAPVLVAAAGAEGKKRQRWYAGVLMNHGAGYHKYDDVFFRARGAYNFSTGLYGQWQMGRFVGLQAEGLYDLNQSRIQGGTFRRHSVTLPLNVQLQTPTAQSGFRLFLFAGPYYRYHFGASWTGSNAVLGEDIRQDEWGYSFGIGVDIFRFHICWTARRGLTNILTDSTRLPNILDRNSLLTLGYRF
jgi:aminopeptidase YwaD